MGPVSKFDKLAYHRNWYKNNREAAIQSTRRWRIRKAADDPKAFYGGNIFRERKRVALKSGTPFEVSKEYVLSLPSENCPILGMKLEWGTGSQSTASLDRIKPELGYIEGNVHWVSWRANTLKNSSSKEENEKLYEWFQQNV